MFPARNGGVADPYYLLMARAAIGLLLLILVAGCQKLPAPASALSTSPAPPSGQAPAPPSGQVVPWTPLAPNLAPPAPSLGPAPLPIGTPPCQGNDLVAGVTGSNGAIVHGSPPLGGKHIYALNCGEAGPIQPGASVTFQMVFLVPVSAAPGRYTLTFGLGYLNAMTSFAQAVVTLQ